MNRFAFKLTSFSLKHLSGFSKANIHIDGKENIPEGSNIFTANHFTRIETIFLPYHINLLTRKSVWSLAAEELFSVKFLQSFLNNLGAVSTKDPHRDDLIIKTLLSKDSDWIIFPEGMMVKNKKIVKNNIFNISDGKSNRRPHTGAATLALRCEFYRERIRRMKTINPEEYDRLIQVFDIQDVEKVLSGNTYIVPVNITYYPEMPKENFMTRLIQGLIKNPSIRVMDELVTEGGMIFSGVDINIRFGLPITIRPFLNNSFIESDLTSRRKIQFDDKISSRPVLKEISIQIMEQYMSCVYQMTTLNYDHVMACILKHFPYRADGIDIYEFKCKVFLAVSKIIQKKEYFYFKNFYDSQIHLLINDRYNRFEKFFQSARQTGLITIEKNKIFKNQARFVSKTDFHSIRIENPLLVITNEIEPLTEIELFLKTIAQSPSTETYHEVKRFILAKINADYIIDYKNFYIKGESKDMTVGQPVFLEHDAPKAGILLIHGYMAAPAEMAPFAGFLFDRAYTVYAPRLKGHGTSPDDLAQTTYEQWIESVEEAYIVLKHTCDTIFIGGFSTGAGLAVDLCSKINDYKGIITIAPPMQLRDFGSYFVSAFDTWNQMINKISLRKMAVNFIKNEPENPHINYGRNPISGVYQLEKLMDSIQLKLKMIQKPALVVQSRKDPVVKPKGTDKLFKQLGSPVKEYYIFDFERHGILIGKGVERVFQAITGFISHVLQDNK